MPKGHISLGGKPYVITDESYTSKIVAMFRPQLQVEGISHEALDQYLYMVWSTWDKGSNQQAILGRWFDGSYSAADKVDITQEGRLKLQPSVSNVHAVTGNKKVLLIALGAYLYAFIDDGTVKQTLDGTTWTDVVYDYTTQGKITCLAVLSAGSPYVAGTPPPTTAVVAIAGTDKGKIISFSGKSTGSPPTLDLTLLPTFTLIGGIPVTSVIRSIGAYQNLAVATYDQRVAVYNVNSVSGGGWGYTVRYTAQVPGVGMTQAVFNRVLMLGMQAAQRGSIIMTADKDQVVDYYSVLGAFIVQSMGTWGSSLLYAGFRPGQEGVGEVYTFPETLADTLPKGDAPVDILAMCPTAPYVLMGWNKEGGLWWIDDKGSGPFCQYASGGTANRIVRSIALFNGAIYYTLDDTGVMRVSSTAYVSSGTIDSGWFDGGFPELQKNIADVHVRLNTALITGQTVTIWGRIDAQSSFTSIGSLVAGESTKVFPIPSAIQKCSRLELRAALTGPGTSTPTVTSVITRYVPVPISKRVWGFTIRAERGLTFLDGTRENRTPEAIIADLFALKTAGEVDFSSVIEPTSRKVYCSDVSIKGQLLGKTPMQYPEECFLNVEVLEV